MSQSNAPAEVFSEAAKAGLTAINSAVLTACTAAGAALSLYADIGRGLLPNLAGHVALAAWLLTLALALYLAGRAAGANGWVAAIVKGACAMRSRPGFAMVVIVLTAGAVFTVWSRAKSDEGGAIATLLGTTAQIQADTTAIKAIVTRELPPAEALARLGFTSSIEDICRAYSTANLDALALFAKSGMKAARVSIPVGDGQYALCIEPMLTSGDGQVDVARLLAVLPIAGIDLSRMHIAQTYGTSSSGPIQLSPLIQAIGAGNASKMQLMAVFSSPLMFAVWGGNAPAVQALLGAGADANQGAKLMVMGSSQRGGQAMLESYSLLVTPLFEARRLQSAAIVEALQAAGGQAKVSKGAFL